MSSASGKFLAFSRRARDIRGMRGAHWVLLGFLVGCGADPLPPAAAPKGIPKTGVANGPRPSAPRPPQGALFREDVNALIEQGFPQFLQRIDVEPRLVEGQFRGWTIVNLSPSEFWSNVDLKRGDIVTRVNDLPIERETEAYDAFVSLKAAPELRVTFQRDGQPRLLEYKIVSRN
jgi:type II secretory pathway component PulC